jgi:hypothetical protein
VADAVVNFDQGAIDAMCSDWDSGIGRYIAGRVTEVEAAAKSLAPVSAEGSKYAPPGYLKASVHAAYSHGPDGSVLGLVGVPLGTRGGRYPLNFVANPRGATRNANRVDGVIRHYGFRPAADRFLTAALHSVMG